MKGENAPFRVNPLSSPEQPTYHSRRPHRKSRAGCAKCKQRRVKVCDETRPCCQKCEKLGLECTYEAILPPGYGKKDIDSALVARVFSQKNAATLDATAHSLAVGAVTTQVDEVLQLSSTMTKSKGCLSNLEILRHFQDIFTPNTMIINETGKDAMRVKMVRLALESPYLMHSLIGVAIAHLRNVLPDDKGNYALLESHHWQRAINQYSTELQSSIGPHNMDALFSACLLMTVNSFALNSYNPRQSFVFSPNPVESLNWLFVQSGLRHLLSRAVPWVRKSMWWAIFMESRNDLFEDERPGGEGLHPDLANLCGINEFTPTENNPYLWPLRMLTPLLTLEPSLRTYSRITTFMGRLLPDYYERLVAKDTPALMILAWWLALMMRVDLWWVKTRVKSECAAICMYLDCTSSDSFVLRLLEFPAQACGYLLQHNQANLSYLDGSQCEFSSDAVAPLQPVESNSRWETIC
ncbi:hypothetical protein BDV09DRAFT_185290 [Aspergillus tetrazonus]